MPLRAAFGLYLEHTMSNNNGARDNTTQTQGRHLVASAGGSRAILGTAGVILATDQAGIKDWDTVGGVSGGSVPTSLYKSKKLSAKDTLKLCLDIDFSSMLTRHGSILQIVFAYFMQGRFEKSRPRHGVMSSEKLGEYIDDKVRDPKTGEPVWPKGFWTMAVVGNSQVLFDEFGVREISPEGVVKVLSETPAPLGLAVRASCAVPGIISAVPYKGRWLFDGALSRDGSCPVEIPQRYYGATHPEIIACSVGDDNKTSKRVLRLWKWICGGACVPAFEEPELSREKGMIVIEPELTNFRSLQFTLTRDQKWTAVMESYATAVAELEKAGHMTGQALADAKQIMAAYSEIQKAAEDSEPGLLSLLTEDLLTKYGLY